MLVKVGLGGEEDIDNSIFCILSLVTCSNIVRMF